MSSRILTPVASLLFACILSSHAADTTQTVQTQIAPAETTVTNSVSIDSVTPVQPLSLLPDRLGPMEKVMWSPHGVMRSVFDFPLTEDGREKEMKLRRTMLEAHEIAGFATLAAMIATCVVGQIAYNEYPNRINPTVGSLKSSLAAATILMYFGTASLSIFTPPPMIRRNEWSTVSTHKLLATIHFTGMLLTPLLADYIGGEHGGKISRTGETVHMISGYTTTAAFAAAMLVVTF